MSNSSSSSSGSVADEEDVLLLFIDKGAKKKLACRLNVVVQLWPDQSLVD